MPVQIPHINIFSSRNKPHPPAPKQQQEERPLTPLPELELAGLSPDLHRQHHHHQSHAQGGYEAAPLPEGIEYPASPLVGGAKPRRRAKDSGEPPLSPLVVATGLSGLKERLMMPWRRNTTK